MTTIDRRTLLQAAASFSVLGTAPAMLAQLATQSVLPTPTSAQIHTVLLVTKCHLDVGFTMTQQRVLQRYFDVYFPQAIERAAAQRAGGSEHYTWTTGSWLLYEYLEQAGAAQRKAAEQAIAARDLAWHALPFNWQTEMIDRSMIDGAMAFSRILDERFSVTTTGAKMTDVPGHSRGLVAPLAQAGVRLLDIGVNAASTPPDVPDIFLWREPGGQSVAVIYHRHDYGSVLEIPGTGVAVDVEVRNDNSGPHTADEISAMYIRLRTLYPHAAVRAATFNDVAAVVDTVRLTLPVVTSEIGDTWIYGCASDPSKVAEYRCTARLRQQWIAKGRFVTGDSTDRNLLRRCLLAAEHTWGTDTKTYLDDSHYRPTDLATVLDQPGYTVMRTSWQEKRQNTLDAISHLPDGLKLQAQAAMRATKASIPETQGMHAHDPAQPLETANFTLRLDPATGAIIGLRNKRTGVEWASDSNPLALFTYQTLSPEQYAAYLKHYLVTETDWGPKDFGKPGMERFTPLARDWHPRIERCSVLTDEKGTRAILELAIVDADAERGGNVAWPARLYLELALPVDAPRLDLRLTSLGKISNRLPEAMWLSFAPRAVTPDSWEMDKVDQPVRADDVVRNGGRAMHAVSGAVRCTQPSGRVFQVHTLDAPVIAFGERSPLNFSPEQPHLSRGMHVCLYNNGWGTNYLQWNSGNWLYRFSLSA